MWLTYYETVDLEEGEEVTNGFYFPQLTVHYINHILKNVCTTTNVLHRIVNYGYLLNNIKEKNLKRHSNSIIESYFNTIKINLRQYPDIVVPGRTDVIFEKLRVKINGTEKIINFPKKGKKKKASTKGNESLTSDIPILSQSDKWGGSKRLKKVKNEAAKLARQNKLPKLEKHLSFYENNHVKCIEYYNEPETWKNKSSRYIQKQNLSHKCDIGATFVFVCTPKFLS